jgi:hypothetical protein
MKMTHWPIPRLTSSRLQNIFLVVALFLLAAILGACHPDTSAIAPWTTSASPAFVCPGDSVTLFWDSGVGGCLEGGFGGGGGCPDIEVEISSAPVNLFGSGFSSIQYSASTTAGPITTRTTFTFSGTADGASYGPYAHTVDVILPDRITSEPVTLGGTCSGDAAAWTPQSLAVGTFRSSGVRVVRFTNTNPYAVNISVSFSAGDPLIYRNVLPGASTPEIDPARGALAQEVSAAPVIPVLGVVCTEIASYPAPVELEVEMTCDLSSASMPIVAGTPEAEDTPQEAFIVTNTPSATPKITTNRNANCRRGPNDIFDVVTVLNEGYQTEPNGRDWQSTWWRILTPDGLNFCWVSNLVVDFEGPEEDVAVVDSPPTPAVGCLIYDESTPNDLYDTTCVSRACTDQDQPGGECTP